MDELAEVLEKTPHGFKLSDNPLLQKESMK